MIIRFDRERGAALAGVLASALAFAGCQSSTVSAPPAQATAPVQKERNTSMISTPSGLQYEDTKEGTGASPKAGQTCVMHYTGWLWENGAKGKKFDSSLDHGQPVRVPARPGPRHQGLGRGRRHA